MLDKKQVADEKARKAKEVGCCRQLLFERLNEAKAVLSDWLRPLFIGARFDFNGKRLISNDGRYSLKWLLRHHPDRTESYYNQQTSRGSVVLIEKKD